MTNLITTDVTMTSLQLAEITGKKHPHVMRDIRNEIKALGDEINESIFGLVDYTDAKGEKRPCYTFGRKGAMQLALKYDAKTRYKVIKKLEELERLKQGYTLPQDYLSALKQLVISEEERQLLLEASNKKDQIIGELRPKADFVDTILKNTGLVTITQIAKDYGMSAKKMNELLHNLKIQFKQSGQWLLYREYHAKGFVHSETVDIIRSDGRPDVKMNTKWTQKGRLFIYNTLKESGILPVIER